jgi:hypothetical protein
VRIYSSLTIGPAARGQASIVVVESRNHGEIPRVCDIFRDLGGVGGNKRMIQMLRRR